MYLLLCGNDFHFEMENICRLFLPQEKIVTLYDTAVSYTHLDVDKRQV